MKVKNIIITAITLATVIAASPLYAQNNAETERYASEENERTVVISNESRSQMPSGLIQANTGDNTLSIENIKRLLDSDLDSQKIGLKFLLNNIKNGDDVSINLLGDLYRYGKGNLIKKNIKEAIKYYQEADLKGNTDAACSLGFIYLSGEGVEIDEENGVKYMKRAADNELRGNNVAQFNVGYMYENGLYKLEKNDRKAFEYYEKAAKQKNLDAICALGIFYFNGRGGCLPNHKRAVEYLQTAADAKIADAYPLLGFAYLTGKGVETDINKALHYLRLGDAAGNAEAMYYLGNCYELGIGVNKSKEKALAYYKKSAKLDFSDAAEKVAQLTKESAISDSILRKIGK